MTPLPIRLNWDWQGVGVDGGRGSAYKLEAVYWLREKPMYKEGTRGGGYSPATVPWKGRDRRGRPASRQGLGEVFWNQPQLLGFQDSAHGGGGTARLALKANNSQESLTSRSPSHGQWGQSGFWPMGQGQGYLPFLHSSVALSVILWGSLQAFRGRDGSGG